jgi:hypothetical protein
MHREERKCAANVITFSDGQGWFDMSQELSAGTSINRVSILWYTLNSLTSHLC